MNKISFIILIILLFSLLYADIDKIDPLFCSYFADSIGNEYYLTSVNKKNIFIGNYVKTEDGIVHFENVLLKNKSGEIGIIVKGNVSIMDVYLNDMIQISDSIATGFSNYQSILLMSENPEIDFIEVSKPMFQSSDSGAYYTKITTMNYYGYNGENVILGFIDNRFSPDNECFYNENSTKFLKVWNQLDERIPPPDGYSYGEELDSSSYKIYRIEDYTGHGTSILSILVGQNSVEGMVKNSTVIGVSCYLSIKSVIDGLKFIEEKAVSLNKPFVVIMPLNHYWGAHKGEGLLEEVINEMFADQKQKRGISVPVGNLGNMFIHASELIKDGDTSKNIMENPFILAQAVKNYNLDVDITYDELFYVRFILRDKSGLWKSDWIDIENAEVGFLRNDLSYIGFGLNKLKKNLHILLKQLDYTMLGIEFSPKDTESQIDCYIAQGGYFVKDADYQYLIEGDRNMTIASPALSPQVISSASYVSRRKITENLISPDILFHILQWSGKSKEYIIKPDIYSPGKYIFALGLNRWGIPVNDTISAFQGTSYSAAYTGAALIQLLQSDTFLNVNELYSQLKRGADVIPDDVAREENLISYGFLNVYNSLKSQTVKTTSCPVSIFVISDTMIGIQLLDYDFSIIEANEKNSNRNLDIKNKQFAIDKNPNIGNNIYMLYLTNTGGENLIVNELFNFNNKKNSFFPVYFDISGRVVNKKFFKQGVLFEKQNGKIKKIVKF